MGAIEEAKPCWRIVCDVCCEQPETGDGGHVHYESREEAESSVRDYEWHQHEGFWACESCIDGELDEVDCPVCGAPANEGCHQTAKDSQRGFHGPHHERVDAAVISLKAKESERGRHVPS